MRLLKLLVFTLALTLPFVLRADDINFDNLPVSTVVSSQYPQAVFSSDPGEVLLTVAQNLGSSLPNFICTAPAAGVIDCTHSVIVKFTSPVNNLTFLGTGVNDTGKVAEVDVFQNGVLSSTVDMMGISTIAPVLVDLSAFTNVTSIDIHDITDTGRNRLGRFRLQYWLGLNAGARFHCVSGHRPAQSQRLPQAIAGSIVHLPFQSHRANRDLRFARLLLVAEPSSAVCLRF